MDELTGDELTLKRDRSPSFPYLRLSAAIDLAKSLHQAAKQSEVRLSSIAPAWNTTSSSGALMKYAAALQAYGLIESSGSNDGRKIKLTDAARRILEDTRPGVKEKLTSEAALKPKLISELYSLWGHSRPVDDIAKSTLQFDYNFTPDGTRRFLAVYDEALDFLTKPVGSEEIDPDKSVNSSAPMLSIEASEQKQIRHDTSRNQVDDLHPNPHINHARSTLDIRQDVFTLDEGEVIITLPKKMSQASFDDFCDWLELVKRKASRSISA